MRKRSQQRMTTAILKNSLRKTIISTMKNDEKFSPTRRRMFVRRFENMVDQSIDQWHLWRIGSPAMGANEVGLTPTNLQDSVTDWALRPTHCHRVLFWLVHADYRRTRLREYLENQTPTRKMDGFWSTEKKSNNLIAELLYYPHHRLQINWTV